MDEESEYRGRTDCDGLPHGRGTLIWPESSVRYEGHFHHGMKHGRGCLYFSDGSILSGRFKNDGLEGLGVYSYTDGGTMEALYDEGELNGCFTEYDKERRVLFEGRYLNNVRFGHCRL